MKPEKLQLVTFFVKEFFGDHLLEIKSIEVIDDHDYKDIRVLYRTKDLPIGTYYTLIIHFRG